MGKTKRKTKRKYKVKDNTWKRLRKNLIHYLKSAKTSEQFAKDIIRFAVGVEAAAPENFYRSRKEFFNFQNQNGLNL